MTDARPTKTIPAKPGLLRWEIGIALLIKVVLLAGLWFLIFRWQDRPVSKPDVAGHFSLPSAESLTPSNLSSQPLKKESLHDR